MLLRFVSLLIAFCCLLLTNQDIQAQETRQPNIVVILADDLGYGDLTSYGASDLQTPHIDGLMSSGMRFTHFYANSPVCSPTRAALMSGRFPDLVGVPGVIRTHARNSWGYLSADAVLLPEMLKRAGYHTAIIGKWHLGLDPDSRPHERGFDHFHGFLGDMMDDYYTHRRHGINYMRLNDEVIDPEGHATDLFTQWAVDYIRERAESEAPFFLYLAYNAPHTPIQPPEEWIAKVMDREPGIDEKRAQLVALIEHMDAGVGQVLKALEETGEHENTLIIFTSDNGGQISVGASNGPLRDGKGTMYEGGIRVPMGAVWPGHIQPGTTSDRIGMVMDIYPTLAEVAGIEVTHYIEGRSILPVLLGTGQPAQERTLVFVRREGGNTYMGRTIWALRQGDWKLLQNTPTSSFELYNLRDDPKEERDLSEQNKPQFNRLAAKLRDHIRQAGAVLWQDR